MLLKRGRCLPYPVRVWLLVLTTIFATEWLVMQVLPWILPEGPTRLLESAVDAFALTLVLAPLLWWAVVRPLKEVIRLRAQFLADLFAQIEKDRRQIAHELHDGVGQSLTLLVSGLRSVDHCVSNPDVPCRSQTFQRLAEEALRDVKRLARGLRPSLLDDLGLAPALERLVSDMRAHSDVDCSLEVSGVNGTQLPERVATAVFRIVQEALANVLAHARARQAAVQVRRFNGNVVVEVTDDGCGIEPARLRTPPPGHLGLTGMRERATLLGGRFSIDSTPGRGTRIGATIPT